MNQTARRVMVVHDKEGLPLAVMPVEERAEQGGIRTGHRPVLRAGQQLAEIELDQEQQQIRLEELLQYRVTYAQEKPALRRRIRD